MIACFVRAVQFSSAFDLALDVFVPTVSMYMYEIFYNRFLGFTR